MEDISYFTMGDVSDTAEFARGRKRGSRDKKPRKRRMMIAGGIAGGAGGLGGAYGARIGMAGRAGMRANSAIASRTGLSRMFGPKATTSGKAFRTAARGQMGSDLAAVKMGATKGARGINVRSRKAVGILSNSARSAGGMLKGRKGLALAGAGAIATGAGGLYAVARSRRRR